MFSKLSSSKLSESGTPHFTSVITQLVPDHHMQDDEGHLPISQHVKLNKNAGPSS